MSTAVVAAALPVAVAAQTPDFGVDLPAEPAPGVVFPTAETELNAWIFGPSPAREEIVRHGWGLWAGLTAPSGASRFGIENAAIYQTWLSPSDIIALMEGRPPPPTLALRSPLQFQRGSGTPHILEETPVAAGGLKVDYAVAEVVAYSPASAEHAYTNELLWTDTLNAYVEQGYTEIPPFPPTAVNIKPVYKRVSQSELHGGSIYAMPAWPGTPADVASWTPAQQERGFPNTDWGQCVYIDVDNPGTSPARGVDPSCANPSAHNTYGLGDFISIAINADNREHFEALRFAAPGQAPERVNLEDGDHLILVGMHVTSRETERWTWQTFWWAADPAAPNAPSSAEIAAARPDVLTGAAAHYAMAIAYSMLAPAQPLTAGHNIGALQPAYNPHLEAGFGSHTFGLTRAVETPSGQVTTNLGVQSNCMSCHGMAGYATANTSYTSNVYVPRDAAYFEGGITVDFAWSIADEAEPRPDGDN